MRLSISHCRKNPKGGPFGNKKVFAIHKNKKSFSPLYHQKPQKKQSETFFSNEKFHQKIAQFTENEQFKKFTEKPESGHFELKTLSIQKHPKKTKRELFLEDSFFKKSLKNFRILLNANKYLKVRMGDSSDHLASLWSFC